MLHGHRDSPAEGTLRQPPPAEAGAMAEATSPYDEATDADLAAFRADAGADTSGAFASPDIHQELLAGETDRGLIGRHPERRQMVCHLMQGECPLLLCGLAGRGKSALVDVVSAEFLERDYDVVVLEVAPGATFEDITRHLGTAVAQNSPRNAGRLAPRPLLIVVDAIERLASKEERDALLRLAHDYVGEGGRARWCLAGRGRDAGQLFSSSALSAGPLEILALGLLSDQDVSRMIFRLTAYWGLGITPGALRGLVLLSRGLPSMVVRLCETIARHLAAEGRGDVTLCDVSRALNRVAALQAESQASDGHTGEPDQTDRLAQAEAVLLACARAPHDVDGSFRLEDVATGLYQMPFDAAAVQHMIRKLLVQLHHTRADEGASPLVELIGPDGLHRYAFADDRVPVQLLMRAFAGRRR